MFGGMMGIRRGGLGVELMCGNKWWSRMENFAQFFDIFIHTTLLIPTLHQSHQSHSQSPFHLHHYQLNPTTQSTSTYQLFTYAVWATYPPQTPISPPLPSQPSFPHQSLVKLPWLTPSTTPYTQQLRGPPSLR